MTKLTRPVRRETSDVDPCFGRTLLVMLEVGGKFLRIWQKGRRQRYTVTYAEIWRLGMQNHARAVKAELVAKRKAKKAAKQAK
jgi:hypothetical protein